MLNSRNATSIDSIPVYSCAFLHLDNVILVLFFLGMFNIKSDEDLLPTEEVEANVDLKKGLEYSNQTMTMI